MAAQPWLIRSEMQPAFNGGFIQSRFLIGGIFVVKNKAQRNAIHILNRKLDSTTTTLVVVTDENRIYQLASNPTSTYTTDTDWSVFFVGQTSSFRPVGLWDADNNILVLQDTDAINRNGEFYFVSDAPTQRTVTHSGLFGGVSVNVVNGDLVVSTGDAWTLITSTVQWDALNKPQVITDYVNGTVIAHTHPISDISGLTAALDLKYDVGDVAPINIAFSSVSDTAIVEVQFLRTFYYTKTQVDGIISSFSGYTDEQAQDAVGNIIVDSTSINFTYSDGTPSITAVVIPGDGLHLTSGGVALGGTSVSDITIAAGGYTGALQLDLQFGRITAGDTNTNTGHGSFIFGIGNTVSGNYSFNAGKGTTILSAWTFSSAEATLHNTGAVDSSSSGYSHIVGNGTNSFSGGNSLTFGAGNLNYAAGGALVGGVGSRTVWASGQRGGFAYAFPEEGGPGGLKPTDVEYVTAIGGAFNVSRNTNAQTTGHGAYGRDSAILGGVNSNIPSTSPRTVVLGGNAIKARASDPDQVYVSNLNIVGTMSTDDALTRVLVVDPTTGQIKYRASATIGGGGGLTDGDYGDIIISGTGTILSVDPTVILDNRFYKLRTSATALTSPSDGWTYYDSTLLDERASINGSWTNLTRPQYFTSSATSFTLTEAHRNAYIYFTSTAEVIVTLPILSNGFTATLIKQGLGDVVLSSAGSYEAIGGDTTISTRYTGATVYLKPGGVWAAYGALGTAASLTDGNGTVANGTGIDLGGTLLVNTTINGANKLLEFGIASNELYQFRVKATDIISLTSVSGGVLMSAGASQMNISTNSALVSTSAGGSFAIGNVDTIFTDSKATKSGIKYAASGYVTDIRSLTDQGYVLGAKSYTGKQTFVASTTAASSFNIPTGAAPTTGIANGDVWQVSNHLYTRLNGVSYQLDQQSGTYTDENAQDAVAGMIVNGKGITVTYVDATPSLTFSIGGTFTGDILINGTGNIEFDSADFIVSSNFVHLTALASDLQFTTTTGNITAVAHTDLVWRATLGDISFESLQGDVIMLSKTSVRFTNTDTFGLGQFVVTSNTSSWSVTDTFDSSTWAFDTTSGAILTSTGTITLLSTNTSGSNLEGLVLQVLGAGAVSSFSLSINDTTGDFESTDGTNLTKLIIAPDHISVTSAAIKLLTTPATDESQLQTLVRDSSTGQIKVRSSVPPIASVSIDTTLTTAHRTVKVDASGANRVISLPAASTVTGRVFSVIKSDTSANTVTIDPNSTETLSGALTKVINAQWSGYMFQSDGSNYVIISSF